MQLLLGVYTLDFDFVALHSMQPQPVLPDELTGEILSWLPVKSLIQFKCVTLRCPIPIS